MTKVISALLFVLLVNILFFWGELGINNINPTITAPTLLNYEDSMLSNYDTGNYTLKQFQASDLPDPQAQVDAEGNFFTDIFSTIRNWFLSLPGVSPILGIVNAVPNFLKIMGLPIEIAYSLGFLWHCLSVFIIVMSLKT